MIINANLSRRRTNILMSINASIVILYTLEGLVRCPAKDEDNPYGTEFDLRVQMEFPFEVNESPMFEITAAQFLHELSLSSLIFSVMINSFVTLISISRRFAIIFMIIL